MPEQTEEMQEPKIDPKVFWPGLLVVLGVILPLALFPEEAGRVLKGLLSDLTSRFGWLYLLSGTGSFVFMLWVAFGGYGSIKLGAPEDVPEFSKTSWLAMLFAAGIGISIVHWAFVEPLYFLSKPPLGIEVGSDSATEYAAMYPYFHWGVVPWALYLLPALPIAYSMYVRQEHFVRLSHACRAGIGPGADGWLGKLIDVVVIFSILGGVGTSLGLSVPLVSALFGEMFGLAESMALNMLILGIWTAIFSWSVYQGLSKGIQTLSYVNVALALALLGFVLLVGPTVFLLNLWSNSFGLMLANFFRISFWTDPITKSGFTEAWTIFYWAWWIAYCPMMGLFVARISRGRTVRELILNGVLWGSLGCWTFFAIWGGYAIHIERNGTARLLEVLAASGIPATIIAVLKTLPLAPFLVPVFTLLCFVFLATTLDSSAYMLASICSKDLTGYQEPARWNRLLWALVIALVGVGLLMVGGLEAVQISTILVALPMIPVLAILGLSFLKWAKEDFGAALKRPVYALRRLESGHTIVRQTGAPALDVPGSHAATPALMPQGRSE